MTKIEALLEIIHLCEENPRLTRALEDLLIEDSPVKVEMPKAVQEESNGFKQDLEKAVAELEGKPVKEKPKKAQAKPAQRKSRVDVGRIKALRTGGWTIAEIADDVKCTQKTVRNNLAKLGMK